MDNGECLDLIERKLGVLSLIDEESKFPKVTESVVGLGSGVVCFFLGVFLK